MSKYIIISGTAMLLMLAACSSEAQNADKIAQPNTVAQAVPPPAHALKDRTLTIQLPYRRADKMAWVAGNPAGTTGPFRFVTSHVEQGAGSNAIDVYSVTYEASGPGSVALRFALVPVGKTLIGPKKSIFEGTPANDYTANVTVK